MPVVEGGEPSGDRRDDRHLLGGVAGHDLRVLLIAGLAAHLGGERADVVGDEPVHRRRRVRIARRVERRGHLLGQDAPVAGRVDHTEQLGVDVGELLARIRVRRVHVLRDPVRHELAVRAVLGPRRDRVGQLLADHALEGGHLTRLIQPAKQVVEGPVLEHHRDDMIERVPAVRRGHGGTPNVERKLREDPSDASPTSGQLPSPRVDYFRVLDSPGPQREGERRGGGCNTQSAATGAIAKCPSRQRKAEALWSHSGCRGGSG